MTSTPLRTILFFAAYKCGFATNYSESIHRLPVDFETLRCSPSDLSKDTPLALKPVVDELTQKSGFRVAAWISPKGAMIALATVDAVIICFLDKSGSYAASVSCFRMPITDVESLRRQFNTDQRANLAAFVRRRYHIPITDEEAALYAAGAYRVIEETASVESIQR